MSLILARSEGLEVKTNPTWLMGDDMALRLSRPGQESLFFSMPRCLDETEYTLNELAVNRLQDIVAVHGFKRYLASIKPQLERSPLGETLFYRSGIDYMTYRMPELSDTTDIDWCGVLINPTDFLCATRYIVTNTPVELNDPRAAFINNVL